MEITSLVLSVISTIAAIVSAVSAIQAKSEVRKLNNLLQGSKNVQLSGKQSIKKRGQTKMCKR